MASPSLSPNSFLFFSSELTINELIDVLNLLKRCGFPQTRWYELGLTLGLHKDTLDAIKRENDTTNDCLTECISKWLSRADNVDSKGGATFNSLSDALKFMNENPMNETKTVCCCLTKCFPKWLFRACDNAEGGATFDSLSNVLKSMNEIKNAATNKLIKPPDSLWMVQMGSTLARRLRAPVEGVDPMTVTPEVISIAEKMKKEAEKKLKTSFTTYSPLYYIKEGETDYCIRVKVDQLIDVCGQYCAGSVMRVKAKLVTEDDDQAFF